MPPTSDDPFPVEAARELLSLARAMYRGATPDQRRSLEVAGRKLANAIRIAERTPVGHTAYGVAWGMATAATAELGALVADACERVVPRKSG